MSQSGHTVSESELSAFLGRIDRGRAVTRISELSGTDRDDARRRLDMYLNEASVALDLVRPWLAPGQRLLEVGAGIGAFSAFLADAGFEVTAIEPAGAGFDFMHAARVALDEQWPETTRRFHPIGVEDLDAAHGEFDLVFSVHVLEHVPDVRAALASIHARVAPGGRSVHVCPNYAFPYDPHFGRPLVPLAPGATARLLPARITESGMWKSLNFVTARQIRRFAHELGLTVSFRPGVLSEMLDRIRDDVLFRERHARLGSIVDGATRLGLQHALRRTPAGLASPMIFTLEPA